MCDVESTLTDSGTLPAKGYRIERQAVTSRNQIHRIEPSAPDNKSHCQLHAIQPALTGSGCQPGLLIALRLLAAAFIMAVVSHPCIAEADGPFVPRRYMTYFSGVFYLVIDFRLNLS